MKFSTRNLLILSVFLFSQCKAPQKTENPKEHLAALKEQLRTINQQIKELELQIAESDTTSAVAKSKLVILDTLGYSEFKYYVELQGSVDASNNVLAAPQMPGVVTSIKVKEGDKVSPGQILATLDGSTIRQGIEELKTGLSLANTMYDKQKRLWDQKIGSETQYLQVKNQKEQLEQKLITMQSQLSMTYIKSPIQGIVDEVKIKIGEMASPGFSGIRVVNNKDMKVVAKLSDSYLGKLKTGDKAEVYFAEYDKTVDSKITYLSKTINPATRTLMLEVQLPHGKLNYISNQAVKLKINNGSIKNALVISSNLIQNSIQGENYILVAEHNNGNWYARKKTIETGVEYNGLTQITKGLKPGDLIISSGYSELVDGQLIAL